MGKVMAIGGGDLTVEKSFKLVELLVSMSDKKRPRFLFFSAASEDDPRYIAGVKAVAEKAGCVFDELTVVRFSHFISREFIKNKIEAADILLIGDGDVVKLLKVVGNFSIDKMFNEFNSGDRVLAGIGKGANVLFTETVIGKSYSPENDMVSFNFNKGLGYLPGVAFSSSGSEDTKNFENWNKEFGRIKGIPSWVLSDYNALLQRNGEIKVLIEDPKNPIKLIGFKGSKYTEKVLKDGETLESKNLVGSL